MTKKDEGTLFIQIIHNRQVRQIKTSYQIHPNEWDGKNSRIQTNQASGQRKQYLKDIQTALM